MFSSTVMPAKSWEDWKVRRSPRAAIRFGLRPVIDRSSRNTSPASGGFMPQTTLRSVVLPAPFGPMIPVISPSGKSTSTESRALTPPNAIETPRTVRAASVIRGRPRAAGRPER